MGGELALKMKEHFIYGDISDNILNYKFNSKIGLMKIMELNKKIPKLSVFFNDNKKTKKNSKKIQKITINAPIIKYPVNQFGLFGKNIVTMPVFAITISENAPVFLIITKAFASFIKMFLGLLFVRVLLQWFIHFDWDSQPWMTIRQVTDPYINIFRGIIPPLMGTMDLTPLIGFYLLQMLVSILMAPFSDSPDIW